MFVASHSTKLALAAFTMAFSALPANADTKAGVDAWSRGAYELAVKEWRTSAVAGDADAQFNLGQAYKLGRGVKTDLDEALVWYRKAAAQGHLQAADSCGHLLHYLQKIPEALPFLIASSERGEPRAQYLLATELFNGVHIEKDWVRSYTLMTRAASAGMASASRSLAQMDQYIPIEQRQAGTAAAGTVAQRTDRPLVEQVGTVPAASPAMQGNLVPVDLPPSSVAATSASGIDTPNSAGSNWRVQLGAFSNAANAEKLWKKVTANFAEFADKKPTLKTDGGLMRLQAGPFASKTAAEAICAKVKAIGQPCLTVYIF
jgi:cell division septation protein DedD